MYRFFVSVDQIREKEIIITGADVNHIKNVLRMKIGEEIAVSNGVDPSEYRCLIREMLEDEIFCDIIFMKEEGVELPVSVTLYQGLPKSDKMEWIIQKAVELGVCRIIPVATGRSIVKLDSKKAASKQERWQQIAIAAAKQSKRGVIPKVGPVMSMKDALKDASDMEHKLIPYEMSEDGMNRTRDLFSQFRSGQRIAVFIGPEGGFEEKEIEAARQEGFCVITLGKRILRTETAGMTVLAWLIYQLED